MTDKANAIIESAIAALRAEAEEIQGKIAALESALNNKGSAPMKKASAPVNGRRKRKAPPPPPPAPSRKSAPVSAPAADMSKTEKLKEAANKRAASWTPEKKRAAAERMRKYWAERKKKSANQ